MEKESSKEKTQTLFLSEELGFHLDEIPVVSSDEFSSTYHVKDTIAFIENEDTWTGKEIDLIQTMFEFANIDGYTYVKFLLY